MFAEVGVVDCTPQSKTGNMACDIAKEATAERSTAERSAMLETDLKT